MQEVNMTIWQSIFITLYAIYALIGSIKGYIECKINKNAFGPSLLFSLLGAWVWGDTFIFGIFWFIVSIIFLFILKNWNLFLLTQSIFLTIRSFGEISYWINQQFSVVKRNPPKNLLGYRFFRDDSIWFIYQIICQCVTVILIIFTIYFAFLWLTNL